MKYILIGAPLLIAVLLAVALFMGGDDAMDGTPSEDDAVNTSEDGTTNGEGTPDYGRAGTQGEVASRVVLEETKTGTFATIGSATLARDGFVAIYSVDSNGKTMMIGSTNLLRAGTHTGVKVQLDKVIAKEQTIVAVLHMDDGDGTFEFPTSDFYLESDTQAVIADVDVVDTPLAEENEALQKQVEGYIEGNTSYRDEDLEAV